ncbi:hypothetical protein [Variovorax sp.]|uniref:hypothetical protein n=1 Tax=Variovorax sp. TaxID=1871043 RepID=UPI00137DCCBC|nr:hypothetical protein [Variovorax sp.]KAF1069170.1 MAG: hypothetical protein GAK39_02883 [Variovorax sp.]
MNEHGDKGGRNTASDRLADDAPQGDETRIAWLRGAFRATIAIVAVIAAAASVPHWGGDSFPITSLVIYVAGMVFVAMPLGLYYESLLQAHERRRAQCRTPRGESAVARGGVAEPQPASPPPCG